MIMFRVAESFLGWVCFSKFRAGLLKYYMHNLLCKFQNTYFPEQLSVAVSGIKTNFITSKTLIKIYLEQMLEKSKALAFLRNIFNSINTDFYIIVDLYQRKST